MQATVADDHRSSPTGRSADENPVSFIIPFDDEITNEKQRPTTLSTVPKRFQRKNNPRCRKNDYEDIASKQRKADERREAFNKAKLARIRERREDCLRINMKAEMLLAQDAKRKGLPGTEEIRRMNSQAIRTTVQSLAEDMSKINFDIEQTGLR